MEDREVLCLSVHQVVDWALRCGDIDDRFFDAALLQDGAKLHRKLQKEMGGDYRAEVALQMQLAIGGIPVLLKGRADGVFTDEDGVLTVDEIKTTTLSLPQLARQQEQHLGQALLYAFMLLAGTQPPPERMAIRLTYYQMETGEMEHRRFPFTTREIQSRAEEIFALYALFLRREADWKQTRDESCRALRFPYDGYRAGQRDLAKAVYKTIKDEKRLYVQAPTGIGKTISALFPCVKAVGEGQLDKLFYLTAKAVTRTVAQEAMERMRQRGLRFKILTLRAKEKQCAQTQPELRVHCNPEDCSFARGHFDRVNAALLDVLESEDGITPDLTQQYAQKYHICPFEFALDIALWADAVVGDYNHVFDPTVYLRRFFAYETGARYAFLIDEAHNLADRVREMYSSAVRKTDFSRAKRELKGKGEATKALRKAAGEVNAHLLALRKENEDRAYLGSEEPDSGFLVRLEEFAQKAQEWLLQEGGGHPARENIQNVYFETLQYLQTAERFGQEYCALYDFQEGGVEATLFCLNPATVIAERLALAKASILFSATLTPLPYYRETLGGEEDDYMLSRPSPFPPENLLLLAHGGISTKYRDRPASLLPIAQTIFNVMAYRKGNYIVYFPSHAYLRQVYEMFCALYPQVRTVRQEGEMDEAGRAAFLEQFRADTQESLLGFCVLGGLFAEGIDLAGDRLIGAVIIGVGLPGISLRQDAIREYYNRENGSGYDYAYVYPGMNKVLQAAGRVIRSENDKGIVVLIDTRYRTEKYNALFPEHWDGMHTVRNLEEMQKIMQ